MDAIGKQRTCRLDIPSRLTQWRPAMQEYLADASISSGFLGTTLSEGLSAALYEHVQPRAGPTTAPALAKGAALHAWLTDDTTTVVRAAVGCDVRMGARWTGWLEWARAAGVDVLLTQTGMLECIRAIGSLELLDTGAKREIYAMFRRWRSWPEVSHKWVPQDEDGKPVERAVCRLRQDLVARRPTGGWVSVQVKTTKATGLPEAAWWRFWRKAYRGSSAFYRAGMRNLFGDEPLKELFVVVRLEPPFPWAWYDLADRAEELDLLWYSEQIPEIRMISQQLGQGKRHGPEEEGVFS